MRLANLSRSLGGFRHGNVDSSCSQAARCYFCQLRFMHYDAQKKGYGRFNINRAPWNITRDMKGCDMKSWFGNRRTKVRTSDWTNRRSKDSWNQRKRSGKGYARFDMSSAPWRKPAEKPEFWAAVENGNEKK